MLSQLLHADELFLMRETIEELRNKHVKLKEAFESKGMKVNLWKTKVKVSVELQRMACPKVKLTHFWSADR